AGVLVELHPLAHGERDPVEHGEQLETAGEADGDDLGAGSVGHAVGGTQAGGRAANARRRSSASRKSSGGSDRKRSSAPVTGWTNSSSAACKACRRSRRSRASARLRSLWRR